MFSLYRLNQQRFYNIGTFFKVRFIQGSGLFRVQFRQVSLCFLIIKEDSEIPLISHSIYHNLTNNKNSLCINFFHLLARKSNIEKCSIHSNKFYHNFDLFESSFTCPGLWASVLAQRLQNGAYVSYLSN